jgi:hypothetical protein
MSAEFMVWDRTYKEGFCVITKLEGFKEQWLLLDGVSLAGKWPDGVTFKMSPQYPKDINLSDNLYGGSYRVISGRLKEALTPLLGKSKVEFLPASILNHKGRVASKEYFVLNPVDIVDCIDVEKSGVVWNSIDPSAISSCEKFVLKEDAIPEEAIMFRPKSFTDTILIRREIAKQLSSGELTSLSFLDLSNYRG